MASLVHVSDNFESASQVSLFDFMHAILIVLVGELIDHSLPLLKELGGSRHKLLWKLIACLHLSSSSILSDSSGDLA